MCLKRTCVWGNNRELSRDGAVVGGVQTMITLGTIALTSLMCWLPMFAQTKKTVFTLPAYSQTPFDPTSLRVPPHFMGHDVARLYHEFAALDNAVKAEFETKDQFNKRLDLAEAK